MGWTHIPDIDSSAAASDDNPFAGPKVGATPHRQVAVQELQQTELNLS